MCLRLPRYAKGLAVVQPLECSMTDDRRVICVCLLPAGLVFLFTFLAMVSAPVMFRLLKAHSEESG